MTCAKQIVIAIIKNGNNFILGSNRCENPQKECPRKDMKTGEGYDLCESVCKQENHAEIDVCLTAGVDKAKGGDMYILGHYYSCDHCKEIMEIYGIKNVYFINSKEDLKEKGFPPETKTSYLDDYFTFEEIVGILKKIIKGG